MRIMKHYLLACILLLLLISISSIFLAFASIRPVSTALMEYHITTRSPRVQIVVARYNESLDFLSNHPFNKCSVIVYNKGSDIETELPIEHLPNIGRCDHSYLYHIVNKYDTLAPVTLFLPASCMDQHKQYKAYSACVLALTTETSVFPGKIFQPSVYAAERHLSVDRYTATNSANKRKNPESVTQPAIIRPFGKWYNEHFPNASTKVACFYGIFAVLRDHIRQHPVSYYQAFLDQLSVGSNPEVGHYMERSWATLFYPYPESCVYPMDM